MRTYSGRPSSSMRFSAPAAMAHLRAPRMSQSLRFRAPVRAGDTVRAIVTVKVVILAKGRALLATECKVRECTVVEGEALVAIPTRRFDGRAVAAPGAAPAARGAPDGATERAASAHHQRHPVGPAHRRALARPAGALRPGRDGVEPLLPLARLGRVGPGPGGAAVRRRTRVARWTGTCTLWTRPSSVPISTPPAPAGTAPSGGEAQAREALGRSQGGFSTKLHLRAEGHGRPVTAVLTGGERHEQVALEALGGTQASSTSTTAGAGTTRRASSLAGRSRWRWRRPASR